MPDEGNLDPGCSRLHHDEYETSRASSRTSSRSTLNQMERWGWSLREHEKHEGYQGRLFYSKDIYQEEMGVKKVQLKLSRTVQEMPALTTPSTKPGQWLYKC